MSYTEIFKESINIFLKNIVSIIKVFLLSAVIVFLVEIILPDPYRPYRNNYYYWDSSIVNMFATNNILASYSFADLLKKLIIGIMFGVNSIAILNLVRGYSYGIGEIIEIIKENYSVLIPVAAIEVLLFFILSKIPFLGGILTIIASLALTYLYFLIEDYPHQNPISYFVESYHRTNGHKISLALLHVLYFIAIMIIIFVVLGLTISIFSRAPIVSVVLLLILLLPIILITMLMTIARALYYEDRREEL